MSDLDLSCVEYASGVLECMECTSNWCQHIKEYILEGMDVKNIWDAIEKSASTTNDLTIPAKHVLIPIVPTLNCWADAILRPRRLEPDGEYLVTLFLGRSLDSEVFVAIASPGEGMNIFRSEIIDLIKGQVNQSKLRCQASGHNYQRQMAVEKNCKSSQGMFAEQFSLYTNNMCLLCNSSTWPSGAQIADPDSWKGEDLIPK